MKNFNQKIRYDLNYHRIFFSSFDLNFITDSNKMSDNLIFNLVLLVSVTVWHLVKSASHNVLNIEKKFRNQPEPGGITKFCHKKK